jgi:hypothetical protein
LKDENWGLETTVVISNEERNLTSNITEFAMLFLYQSLITLY